MKVLRRLQAVAGVRLLRALSPARTTGLKEGEVLGPDLVGHGAPMDSRSVGIATLRGRCIESAQRRVRDGPTGTVIYSVRRLFTMTDPSVHDDRSRCSPSPIPVFTINRSACSPSSEIRSGIRKVGWFAKLVGAAFGLVKIDNIYRTCRRHKTSGPKQPTASAPSAQTAPTGGWGNLEQPFLAAC